MEAKKMEIEVKDPIAAGLRKYGDKAITWLLAAVVIFVFVKFYFDAKETNAKQAADNLASLQEIVKEIEANPSEDKVKTLNDNIKTLTESVAPYDKIAVAYQARSLAATTDLKAKEAYLKNSSWKSAKEEDKLFQELSVFTVARSLLDTEKLELGVNTLIDLANSAKYLKISALSALAKVNPDKFNKIKEDFKNKNPEQIDLVNSIN